MIEDTCENCPLYKTRNKMVMGDGNHKSKILIIGEAPGKDEDRIGVPFVGKSGILLNMWLSTLKLKREDIYIDNAVKCIPLDRNNKIRPPTDEEINRCRHRIDQTIKQMNPDIIITLGKTPLKLFFPDIKQLSGKIGKCINYSIPQLEKEIVDRKLFPLYHPSYFLRNHGNWKPQLSELYKHLHSEELPDDSKDSILYYDIETTSLEPEAGVIKCIGYFSEKYKKGDVIFNNQERFQQILDDHQYHVGYNTKEFDNPYLEYHGLYAKAKQLDLIEIMKKKNPVLRNKCVSFSLNEVCRIHNLGKKKDINLNTLMKENNTPKELQMIKEYCMHDVMLTRKLFKFIDKELEYFGSLMSRQDQMNYSYLVNGTGTCVYKILCNKLGLEEKYAHNPIKMEYGDCRVIQPTQSIHTNINGYIVDFTSAYPHGIMEHNITNPCTRTDCKADWKECEYCYHGNKIYTLFGYYCIKEHGKIEKFIKTVFMKRREYKAMGMDKEQYGCKIVLNAIYGAISNAVFESIHDFDAGQDIMKIQKERHVYAGDRLIKEGYKVMGGDTDSFFIIDPFNDINKLKSVITTIVKELQDVVPFPQPTFKLEIENKIKAIYFIESKKKDKLNKKHYLYITEDNKLIMKGTSLVKLTATRLAKNVFEMLRPVIIQKQQFQFKKSSIDGLVINYLKEDITSIATTKRVKDPEFYKSQSSLQAQIANKYGKGTHEMVKNHKIGVGKGVKYCLLSESKRLSIRDLDLSDVYSDLEPFIKKQKVTTLGKWCK